MKINIMLMKRTVLVCFWALTLAANADTRYPAVPFHSPLTADILAHLQAIASNGPGRTAGAFIKVGDSISAGGGIHASFLGNFEYPYAQGGEYGWVGIKDLTGYESLIPALDYFLGVMAPAGGSSSSFTRDSLATQVGQNALWAISGAPSPLQQEIDAMNPRYALIMYGANDVGGYGELFPILEGIISNETRIAQTCLTQGVVPLFMATPIRGDYEDSTLTLANLVRAMCQTYRIPFINYHRAMMPLPNHGLLDDHIHPTALDYNRRCVFWPEALLYGHNLRNLMALQALDRIYRAQVSGTLTPDPAPAALSGAGTWGDPWIADARYFADGRVVTSALVETYYRFTTVQPMRHRVLATAQGLSQVQTRILDAGGLVLTQALLGVEAMLPTGTYVASVTGSLQPASQTGAYQLVIMPVDESAPGAPGPVLAQSFQGAVHLNWTAAADDGEVMGYRVYFNQTQVGYAYEPSWQGTNVALGTNVLAVSAVDAAGREGPVAIASAEQTNVALVYDDALNSAFQEEVWGTVQRNLAQTTTVFAGASAIEVTHPPGGWGAFGFNRRTADFTYTLMYPNQFKTLRFRFHPGASTADDAALLVSLNGSVNLALTDIVPGLQSNTWHDVAVPLDQINDDEPFTVAVLFNYSGSLAPHYFLDQVHFEYLDDATPPVITDVVVQVSSAGTSATINFQTDEHATHRIAWGIGDYALGASTSAAFAKTHSATLTNLIPATAYQFRIEATDHQEDPVPGNIATYTGVFTTASNDGLPPVLSGLRIGALDHKGAVIGWDTDEQASRTLYYGLPGGSWTSLSAPGLGTNHVLSIAGLAPETTYRYYVVAADAFGNTAQSAESTFTTTAELWLLTQGNKILTSDGRIFHGRGANMHDTRGCNACAWSAPDVDEIKRRIDDITGNWGANFLRLTLESYGSADGRTHWQSLLDDPAYLADIVEIVDYIGTKPGVFVLLSLWVDPSFSDLGWPTAATIDTWEVLAAVFADRPHVLYGLVNEPEMNYDGALNAQAWQSMNDTVAAIRAVEDALPARRHVIAVQGLGGWARHLDYYLTHPILAGNGENIVYETHVYDGVAEFNRLFITPSATLPVVIGEFGPADGAMSMDDCATLMEEAELRDISYLAWTFHPRCPPNLIEDHSGGGCGVDMPLEPTAWGYLLKNRMAQPYKPAPSLRITTEHQLSTELAWPLIYGAFGLQATDSLLIPAWSNLPGPSIEGGEYREVIELPPSGTRYFRLRKP